MAACLGGRQEYVAPYGAARLNTFTVRDDGDRLLRPECARLMTERIPATGVAMLRVHVAESGAVTRAEITRSSGDARVDDIFGRLAARLEFQRAPGSTGNQARLRMGFSCAPDAAVTTMQLVSG
ncbi:MAG TPA: TonB family protein [Gemmatimonadaceae bacterium]|nr:TonB family protein [Gemmatimonadaceae bacterium]